MGLSSPSPPHPPPAERLRCGEASGMAAVAMAKAGGPAPAALITAASIRNAMVVLQAIGGSTNGLVHLAAIAGRVGLPLDLDAFDRIGREVPVLVDLKPSGDHYMEHLHQAGGVPRLLQECSRPSSTWTRRRWRAALCETTPGRRERCRARPWSGRARRRSSRARHGGAARQIAPGGAVSSTPQRAGPADTHAAPWCSRAWRT